MAKMMEFGRGAAQQAQQQQQQQQGGGVFSSVLNAASAAANYIEGAVGGQMGPWEAPGQEWPVDWKKSAKHWYPLARRGQITDSKFPQRENKEKHHAHGENKWYTSHNYDVCGVWLHDCPMSCLCCLLGYSMVSPMMFCWQRHRLQLSNNDNYECCAALWGAKCALACTAWTEKCPFVCLLCEGAFFSLCTLQANRWMVASHYELEDTMLDKAVVSLGRSTCGACGKACCGCPELENLAIILYTPFVGCLFAQHELEMKSRGYPFLGARTGDHAMRYHGPVPVGCGYNGHVIVKKKLPHKHDEPEGAGAAGAQGAGGAQAPPPGL